MIEALLATNAATLALLAMTLRANWLWRGAYRALQGERGLATDDNPYRTR